MSYRRKLIEVALPLEAINKESAREKSIRHGHPSTLHLWWARRPLAACRAVLFSQLVDDPSEYIPSPPTPSPTGGEGESEAVRAERERLFKIIEDLVLWENINNEEVLDKARLEIARSVARDLGVDVPVGKQAIREFLATKAPPVLDPFAGGGSIPLEAQRLGLRAYASDLNPVAVLINKALIEIPPKFAGMPPVHPPHPQPLPHKGGGEYAPHPQASSPTGGEEEEKENVRLEIPEALRRKMVEVARGFRKEATPSEAILWNALRGKKLEGIKFRRQQPIGPFVVDFYAASKRLVVEVDGPIHASQREADDARQSMLESLGLHFVRLSADEVEQDLASALAKIRNAAQHAPLSPRGRGAGGEGQLLLWKKEWKGAEGLAEDVRYYGKWMRDEAYKRIGHLYPPVKITAELLAERPDLKARGLKPGDELTVIAWLWARTVKCPNPACGAQMPLVRSFALSTKKGKEAWVEPVIFTPIPNPSPTRGEGGAPQIGFNVRAGAGLPPAGTVVRTGARCIACDTPVPFDHVRAEGKAGRMSAQMMAIVANGKSGRIYLPPNHEHLTIALRAEPSWAPDTELPERALSFRVQLYGMTRHSDLFSVRQLVALDEFCSQLNLLEQRSRASTINPIDQPTTLAGLNDICVYLGLAISRSSSMWSSLCWWQSSGEFVAQVFTRQALAMVWDYAEVNPFSEATGNWTSAVDWIARVLEFLPASTESHVSQCDATRLGTELGEFLVCTDPPYYDNVGYADLSDFYYVWLRHALGNITPSHFSTMLTPKSSELIATPYRFGNNKQKAEEFFENGLRRVFRNINQVTQKSFPVTVFYAFKQAEDEYDEDELSTLSQVSTGWETMLEGLLGNDFQISGTWPVRTERPTGVKTTVNALASSIVLVCRPRPENAPAITRRDFLAVLKHELPPALRQLQQGSIAPVDLAQAAIGPGMAVFSRYRQVLEADGAPMRIRTALALINQALDEFFAEQEGEYDGDTRWALAWYEQYGHEQGPYGVAETLSKAKNTSVEGLVEAGFLEARAGKVRLLQRDELDPEWDPRKDRRPTAWEACQHLIYALEKGGEQAAAALLAKLGSLSETARDLAYRLYTVCERKGWAQDALGYNMLVVAWPRLKELAGRKQGQRQEALL